MALVHVLLVGQQHGRQEAIEQDDGVVSRLLDVQLERLGHLREPVDDEVAHLLVGAGDLDEHLGPAGLPLALRVHGPQHVGDVELALLRVPLERTDGHGAALREVGATLVAVDQVRVPN